MKEIPNFLYERLLEQYGSENLNKILEGYSSTRKVTFRINRLKTTKEKIKQELDNLKINYEEVSWYEDAFIINDLNESNIRKLDIYNNGEIYLQSLSSMLPVLVLNPKEKESILDMASAPGGKTTQIASLTNDMALITATEKNKIRLERLKYNIKKQGVNKIAILNEDASKLDEFFSFDKILLDAPCSGSGTININNIDINEKLIEESAKIQYQLLKKAISILKSGHEMIYSTCSILKKENEENVNKILSECKVELVPIEDDIFKNIPQLPSEIEGTICVCPTNLFEGFFIAKLRKVK